MKWAVIQSRITEFRTYSTQPDMNIELILNLLQSSMFLVHVIAAVQFKFMILKFLICH